MNKNFWILFTLPLILACQTLLPAAQTAAPPATDTTLSPNYEYVHDSFRISRINIKNGPLLAQLAAEVEVAKAQGLSPFLEFDATWCPPCQAINASLEAEDALTMEAFEGIYLIRADVDEWGWGDENNFKVEAIPVYFKLDDKGMPGGDQVDGGSWNEDIPENFAPVLKAFFHKN